LLTFLSVAQGIGSILSDVRSRIEGIIGNIIDLLRQIVNQVYTWFFRFWSWAAENPMGFILSIANFCVAIL